jgi:hypothetical protein
VTETLCGHSFSASSVSEMNRTLDAALTAFATRRLDEPYPYLILDARYERVREGGVIASQAVLIAVAVDAEGRRQILAVELANRESTSSWREFLLGLRQRGLHGVEFVVSDDHAGLKQAIREVLAEAAWQRCYVHFLRNALDYLPRRANDDCLQELRWIYDRRELAEVRRDLAAWLAKWSSKYPRLCGWVEENIEETLTYYRLPLSHHKHMKSTNMLERLNQEIKRRTHVVRIFPGPGQLPAPGACAGGRDARGMAGKPALLEHGRPARAQKAADAGGGMTKVMPCPSLASCSPPSIGIGGHLTMPPLPHHRAYGSVPRRFGGLSARQRLHEKQSKTFEAFIGEGPMQRARRAQSPWSLRTEDGRTGHLLRNPQATKLLVTSAARLPLDPDDATQASPYPAIQRCRLVSSRTRSLNRTTALSATRRRGCGSSVTVKPRNDRCHGRATALFCALICNLSRPSMKRVKLVMTRQPAFSLRT